MAVGESLFSLIGDLYVGYEGCMGYFVFCKAVSRIYASVYALVVYCCLYLICLVSWFVFWLGAVVCCVGSYSVIPALYRIVSCRSRSVVFRLLISCLRCWLFCTFPGGVFIRCL